MEMSDFDINEVIRKSLETFEGRCNARGIRFSLLFDEPCLPSMQIRKDPAGSL